MGTVCTCFPIRQSCFKAPTKPHKVIYAPKVETCDCVWSPHVWTYVSLHVLTNQVPKVFVKAPNEMSKYRFKNESEPKYTSPRLPQRCLLHCSVIHTRSASNCDVSNHARKRHPLCLIGCGRKRWLVCRRVVTDSRTVTLMWSRCNVNTARIYQHVGLMSHDTWVTGGQRYRTVLQPLFYLSGHESA